MKRLIYLTAIGILTVCCAQSNESLQDRLTVNDGKINEIIAQMTLE